MFEGKQNGSILIVVLWILILITFLTGQYLAHNREKADMAQNAWTSFRQRQAVSSVVHLFSAGGWPIPDGTGSDGKWFRLAPDNMILWVRADKESQRTNLNSAGDGEIKQKIALMMGDDFQREADRVSDCILDWRDADDMVRMNGAEEKDYVARGLPYLPANGPFKTMSELLLVLGVTPTLFWGNPVNAVASDLSSYYDPDQQTKIPKSLLDGFTIYSSDSLRISVLVPGNDKGYLYMNVILSNVNGQLAVVDSQQFMGASREGFDRLIELETEGPGLGSGRRLRS